MSTQEKVIQILDKNYSVQETYDKLIILLGKPFDGNAMKRLIHTIDHRNAIIKLAKDFNVYQGNEYRYHKHDIDKLINTFLIGDKEAKKLHLQNASHHNPITKQDFQESIMDWESARFTKPDKPLTAYQTFINYFQDNLTQTQNDNYISNLKELNLWNK